MYTTDSFAACPTASVRRAPKMTNIFSLNKIYTVYVQLSLKDIIMPKVTMFSTAWCGDCRNTKRAFRKAGIDFSEINIDLNENAANQIIEWSGGKRIIPTIHFMKCNQSAAIILHNPKGRDLDNLILQIVEASKSEDRISRNHF